MAGRSSWRAPGSHSTSSRRFTTFWLPAFEPIMRRGSMVVRTFACPGFRERGLLPALALMASLAMTISATAQGSAAPFPRECALKEITVITLIEQHGEDEDLPARAPRNRTLTMLRATSDCRHGRVGEALAVYESILNLGPVASLPRQRP